tara:strand:- start:290 stop:511 length:222 start_codon:yes stop_codon:yes gene_type:complete
MFLCCVLRAHHAALRLQRKRGNRFRVSISRQNVATIGKSRPRAAKKKRQHEAGVKLLRQVSYRQETYRAVPYV